MDSYETIKSVLDDKSTSALPSMKKLGMEQKHAAALCYLLGAVTGLVFLGLSTPGERLVRHHAWQSIGLSGLFVILAAALWVWMWLVSLVIPVMWLFQILYLIVLAVYVLINLVAAIAAWNEYELTIPIVGGIAKTHRGLSFAEMENKK